MKCSICGEKRIKEFGECAVICSCCHKITCFDCYGIEVTSETNDKKQFEELKNNSL